MHHHPFNRFRGPLSRDRHWWSLSFDGDFLDLFPVSPNQDPLTPANASSVPPSEDLSIRKELVERVRRQIAEGTYETPEKWDIALERLFSQLEEKDSNPK